MGCWGPCAPLSGSPGACGGVCKLAQQPGAPPLARTLPRAPRRQPPALSAWPWAPRTHLHSRTPGGRTTAVAAAGPAPSRGCASGNSLPIEGQTDVLNLTRPGSSAPPKKPNAAVRTANPEVPGRAAGRRCLGPKGAGRGPSPSGPEPVGVGRGREGGRAEKRAAKGKEGDRAGQ